jgi:metal-responsive CopG/Arc/MetJ family transcriptional regulator
MKRVVSIRLKEEVIREMDSYITELGMESRSDFIKRALEYFIENRTKSDSLRKG